MHVIDSSFWLEYFAGTTAGDIVSNLLEHTDALIVPTIIIYEVFKKLLQTRSEDDALFAIAHIRQGNVIDVSDTLALSAAKISRDHALPMADSIIYATTLNYNALLWTQDAHFSGLPSVNYFKK